MNCEKCQELLSDFLEGTLRGDDRALLDTHLAECLSCADVRAETLVILDAAHECHDHLYDPPNERALWLRISNTIEREADLRRATAAATGGAQSHAGFWSRLLSKRWELSLPQLAAAVAALAVSVSLFTTMGVQRLMTGTTPSDYTASGDSRATPARGPLVGGYNPLDSLERQRVNINYWQQRVEQRKAAWNPRVRESFDHSLVVIDQQVKDAVLELQENPHDEVSEEMLNSALRDKIELLREFGDQ